MTVAGALLGGIRDSVVAPPTEEAIEAVEELVPDGLAFYGYLTRFTMLLVLSAGIASFGLLADSAAVVIGAMLVAPLMTPITAIAAATVMARNVRLVRSLGVVLLGTFAAIAVGWLTAFVTGTQVTSVTQLPGEVQARTFPGLLDLGIAVTAGAAAGFILPRRSTTSALPGVGIAVALVPPLATVGITLEVAARTQAANALLLYLTNLAAIIFSASVMLILAGFRPTTVGGHRALTRRVVITLLAVVAVAVPLSVHTRETLRDAALQRSVADALVAWDDNVEVVDLTAKVASGTASVKLLVSGPNTPRPAWRLGTEIERRFGGPVDLQLLYQRTQQFAVSVR